MMTLGSFADPLFASVTSFGFINLDERKLLNDSGVFAAAHDSQVLSTTDGPAKNRGIEVERTAGGVNRDTRAANDMDM